jgi:hypothetical protein
VAKFEGWLANAGGGAGLEKNLWDARLSEVPQKVQRMSSRQRRLAGWLAGWLDLTGCQPVIKSK